MKNENLQLDKQAVVTLIGIGKALGFAAGFLIGFFAGWFAYQYYGPIVTGDASLEV